MKLSAFNVDFSSLSFDPLGSRRPAQAGVKYSYPPKEWLFYRNYHVQRDKYVEIMIHRNRNTNRSDSLNVLG